jgi:hypothetical protein
MQVLGVIQRMCKVVGMAVPDVVYGSDDRSAQELGALANQMAERIAEEHDWQRTRVLATITGDGTSQAFALPDYYSRMPAVSRLRSAEWELSHVLDHDVWLDWQLRSYTPVNGAWTMLGDRIEILPVLASGAVVKYWYQSANIVRSDGIQASATFPYTLPFILAGSADYGFAQTEFLADDDHFQLDWKLLELGMIWQWRANKGLPYAEDMATYEEKKAKLIMRDRGPRAVPVGPVMYDGFGPVVYDGSTYPGTLRAS